MKRVATIGLVAVLAAACSAPGGPEPRAGEPVAESQAALHASCPAAPTQLLGIDVSEYQGGSIDWGQIKANGVAWGYSRVSDGLGGGDGTFAHNWQGMKAAGVIRGAYQYFEPGEDAVAQANMVIDAMGGDFGPGDLSPMIDVEAKGHGAEQIPAIQAWLDTIQAKTGRVGVIYTGAYYLPEGSWNGFDKYPLFVAAYGSNSDYCGGSYTDGPTCPKIPDAWPKWTMFQYTDAGPDLPTLSNPCSCDHDRFDGDLAALMAFAGGGFPYAAAYSMQSWPFASDGAVNIVVGQTVTGFIEMKNTGTKTWAAGVVKLAPTPRDQASAVVGPTWLAPTRVSTIAADVPPGGIGHFELDFTGNSPGDVDQFFGMVAEGEAWFSDPGQGGPNDTTIEVKVHIDPAPPGSAGAPAAGGSPDVAGSAGATAGGTNSEGGASGAAPSAGHSGSVAGHAGNAGHGGSSAGKGGASHAGNGGHGGSAGHGGSEPLALAVNNSESTGCAVSDETHDRSEALVSAVAALALLATRRRRRG